MIIEEIEKLLNEQQGVINPDLMAKQKAKEAERKRKNTAIDKEMKMFNTIYDLKLAIKDVRKMKPNMAVAADLANAEKELAAALKSMNMTGTKGRDGRRTSLRRKFKDPNAELRKDFYRKQSPPTDPSKL